MNNLITVIEEYGRYKIIKKENDIEYKDSGNIGISSKKINEFTKDPIIFGTIKVIIHNFANYEKYRYQIIFCRNSNKNIYFELIDAKLKPHARILCGVW